MPLTPGVHAGKGDRQDLGFPPKAVSPPINNFHNQNEISQIIHVHNISSLSEWLEVPLECLGINLRASIHLFFQIFLLGGLPPAHTLPLLHPYLDAINVNAISTSNLKILYEPLHSLFTFHTPLVKLDGPHNKIFLLCFWF